MEQCVDQIHCQEACHDELVLVFKECSSLTKALVGFYNISHASKNAEKTLSSSDLPRVYFTLVCLLFSPFQRVWGTYHDAAT